MLARWVRQRFPFARLCRTPSLSPDLGPLDLLALSQINAPEASDPCSQPYQFIGFSFLQIGIYYLDRAHLSLPSRNRVGIIDDSRDFRIVNLTSPTPLLLPLLSAFASSLFRGTVPPIHLLLECLQIVGATNV